MEEQDSILLQKKNILLLSTVIILLVTGVTYLKNLNNKKIATSDANLEIASTDEFLQNLITVKSKEEYFNDIILIEQVSYAAPEEVIETILALDNNESYKTNDITKENLENQNAEQNNEQNNKQSIEQSIEQSNEQIEQNNEQYIEQDIVNNEANQELAEISLGDVPPTEYVKVVEARATAYCLCEKCCGKSPSSPGYGMTSSGYRIVPGTGAKVIAVDPSIIPLGSKVYVQGLNGAPDYGYAIAADTGGSVKNLRIDLYMDTHQQALNWGSKQIKVYVLE